MAVWRHNLNEIPGLIEKRNQRVSKPKLNFRDEQVIIRTLLLKN